MAALADPSQRDVMLYHLAGALAQAQQWQEAEEATQDITHTFHHGAACCALEQWLEAEHMIRMMTTW